MDADIKQLYCKYPLKLTSSFEKGFKTDIDFMNGKLTIIQFGQPNDTLRVLFV